MLKKLIIMGMLLMTVQLALADIVIDQVYYDPVGTESGGEFVQLKNTGTMTVDITGWVLATSSSATDATLNGMLGPGQTYLIADNNWNTSKDDLSWPEANHEEAITMKNSDSGVALKDANGTIVDSVGWGTPPNADLYEGTPTSGAGVGESLQRLNDTDDNAVDFMSAIPSFSTVLSEGISVSVTILNPVVVIQNQTILEDDDPNAGLQLTPFPGTARAVPLQVSLLSNKNITVTVYLGTGNNTLSLQNVNGLEQEFAGAVLVDYYLTPGLHNVTITAYDGIDTDVVMQEVEILTLIALDVSLDSLDFGSILPGDSSTVDGDSDMLSSDPTLENIGNVPLNMAYSGTNLQNGMSVINVSRLSLSMDNFLVTRQVSDVVDVIEQSIGIQGTSPISFELDVPQDAVGGSYEGTLTLLGVAG